MLASNCLPFTRTWNISSARKRNEKKSLKDSKKKSINAPVYPVFFYIYYYMQEKIFPDKPRRAISIQFRNIRANQEKLFKHLNHIFIYKHNDVCVFYIFEKSFRMLRMKLLLLSVIFFDAVGASTWGYVWKCLEPAWYYAQRLIFFHDKIT